MKAKRSKMMFKNCFSQSVLHRTVPDELLPDDVYDAFDLETCGIGSKNETGGVTLSDLEAYMIKKGEVAGNGSGGQEFLKDLINEFI
jgi:xylose isomerase